MRAKRHLPSPLLGGLLVLVAAVLPAAGAAEPQRGGTLSIGLRQDPPVVDPIRTGSITERQFAAPIYEALFEVDAQGRVVPLLVEHHTVSDDVRTWRFTLRPGIRFHDGTALDAAAVVANFDRMTNPENRCRCLHQAQEFKRWRAVDALTVELTLHEPNAGLPSVLADDLGTMVSPTAFKADPQGIGIKPVGTGPFRFVEWVRNSRFVVERNPDYWQSGKPYLDRLVLRGMQNSETREAAFKSGQTDVMLLASHDFVAQARKDRRLAVHQPAGVGTEGIYMNLRKPPLDDIRVRRAVAHAIDRDLLIRTLGFGIPTPAYSPFGAGMASIRQPVDAYPRFDRAQARALVQAYGKPVAFSLAYSNDPAVRLLAQSLQQMLGEVGITVTLEAYDVHRMFQNILARQFEASLFRFSGRVDPHLNAYRFLHSRYADVQPSSNYHGVKDARIDALLEQGRHTVDPQQRAATYSELARVLASEVLPVAYTFNIADAIVAKRHVKGLTFTPEGMVRWADLYRQ